MGAKRYAIGLAATAVILMAAQGNALAAPGKLIPAGCQSSASDPPVPGCTQLRGLDAPGAIAFSPDGRSAYASYPEGIAGFDRDPTTGELSFVQCFDAQGLPPCAQTPGVERVREITIPRDGLSVYAAGRVGSTLLAFRRDAASGRLTFASCEYSSYGSGEGLPGCPVGAFEEVIQIAARADGRAIFVSDEGCADNTGDCFGSVLSYARDTGSSLLTPVVREAPRFESRGLLAAAGNVLYELEPGWSSISAYKLSGAAQAVYAGCITRTKKRGCRTRPSISRPRALAATPNGRRLATVANGRVTLFRRVRGAALRFLASTDLRPRPLRSIEQAEFSPDGRSLYVIAKISGRQSIVRFKVNLRKSRIALAQTVAVPSLTEIALAGRYLYATSAKRVPGAVDRLLRFRVSG
jgi:hypothetical protein